jgi:4-aminobutyrate aminotransferase / (S)-3-amino-2-methylpropionate transaminase / 5-aminovalerate transaminase
MAVDTSTGARTAALQAERERLVSRAVATTPLFVERAHGARLVDVDGREYIDFVGGIGTLNGGHTPDAVVAAIKAQAERYLHQCYSIAQYEPYLDVCRRLVQCHPASTPIKAALFNSGAEATENAIKFARYATGRPAVVCFENAFHGRTLMGLSLTSKVMPYKKGFGPFAPEIYRALAPYPYRGIGTKEALESVTRLFKSQVDPASVAAVIYEPVQGEGGFHPASEGFCEGLYAICQEHGILYIDDEVQAGMCRTGYPAAVERFGLEPDLIAWGKSMGGGLPISAVTGRAEIMDAVHPGGIGGTYGGNPISCAAAIAALDQVLDPAFQASARALGDRLRVGLESIASRVPAIGEVRGMGPMLAIELVEDRATKKPAAALAARAIELARERGLILMGAGVLSNVIRVLVPLVATDADVEEGLARLESSLRDAAAAA